jgi:hypothetical protein
VVETLTETQRRILGLIATGMSNQQVADKLFITVGTTKWHLNQIFGRLRKPATPAPQPSDPFWTGPTRSNHSCSWRLWSRRVRTVEP